MHLERSVYGDPALKALCRNPDLALDEAGRSRIVLENSRHILARYPDFAPALYAEACARMNLGQIGEARAAARRAIALDPSVPVYYHIPVRCGDAQEKAEARAGLENLKDPDLSQDGAAMRHFLLGGLADEAGEPEAAFAHWREGNARKRAQIRYDEAFALGRMQELAAAFDAGMLASAKGRGGAGADALAPVFVVGMLRSGTTLVEQVLASLPGVYGAGELLVLPRLIAAGGAGPDYPRHLPPPDAPAWTQLGERYGAALRRIAPDALRIIDKLPLNFLHLGAIGMMAPGARVIHVMRDPLDTCLSCYSWMFAGDVGFTYDLGELGRYYRGYQALMAHWRAALPADMLCEIRYEDLVDDLPAVSRKLAEFCGLRWDACCLEFFRTRRAVGTASAAQVRRPLSRDRQGRAASYAPWLGDLRAALAAGPTPSLPSAPGSV